MELLISRNLYISKLGFCRNLYFSRNGIPPPLNVPTPTPAPGTLLEDTSALGDTSGRGGPQLALPYATLIAPLSPHALHHTTTLVELVLVPRVEYCLLTYC